MLDIRFPDWAVSDKQSGTMLLFGLYDGRIMLRVRPLEKGAQPVLLKKLEIRQARAIRKVIEKIQECSPETKLTVKFDMFDRQSNQRKLLWTLTFEQDSKRCYRIHLTDVQTNRTHVFAIKGSASMSIGTDVMDEATRSALMMQDLMAWLDLAFFWYPATIKPFDPNAKKGNYNGGNRGNYNRGGGNGGGGGGYNRPPNAYGQQRTPSQYGGSSQPTQPPPAPADSSVASMGSDDDIIPF